MSRTLIKGVVQDLSERAGSPKWEVPLPIIHWRTPGVCVPVIYEPHDKTTADVFSSNSSKAKRPSDTDSL